jgi:two-component system chemotaxis response regulator CheB
MNMIIIGGSAGSFQIILSILKGLDKNIQTPIILVLHRLKNVDSSLEKHLQLNSHYKVKEAEDKDYVEKGVLYTVPADYHLLLEENGRLSLDSSEPVNYSRPSIDVTFESFSTVLKDKCYGVLLSGSNHDGAKGLKFIAENGGITIVQDCNEAEFDIMPKAAIQIYEHHKVLTLNDIIKNLNDESYAN